MKEASIQSWRPRGPGRLIGLATLLALAICGIGATAFADIQPTGHLTAADGAANDDFGAGVAVDGQTLVVSAPNKKVGSNNAQGALYVYGNESGSWRKVATLTASSGAANDRLGGGQNAVAVSGDTIVAATPGRSPGASGGCAYVFTRKGADSSGWADAKEQELRASHTPSGESCRAAVAVSGDSLAFTGRSQSDLGAVYVFERAQGTWTESQHLSRDSDASNSFGNGSASSGALAMSGTRLVAGEAYFDGVRIQTQAIVYTAGNDGYDPSGTLTPVQASNGFASSVAISGTTVVVGSFNTSVSIFNASAGSSHPIATLTDAKAGDWDGPNVGASVATDGSLAVTGAPLDGWVDVWSKPPGGWKNSSKPIQLPGTAQSRFFGLAVAADDTDLVAGAPGTTVGSNDGQGEAFTYGTESKVLLKVEDDGTGDGNVTSDPRGINCGKICKASFPIGAQVKLVANPSGKSKFKGFSGGGCSGKDEKCKVTLNAAKTVTAKFVKK